MNAEGNRLAGLPVTILPLPITHMILGNNLMHPLLWKENARNQAQVTACMMHDAWISIRAFMSLPSIIIVIS